MIRRLPTSRLLAVLLIGLSASALRGEIPPLDSLLSNSPFANGANARGKSGEPSTPLEFRGLLYEGNKPLFSLYEAATKHTYWVELNEQGLPFVVRSFDADGPKIQVEYQSRPMALALVQAPKVARPATAPTPAATPAGQPPAANAAPGQPNPQLPAQIAEEIRRRRALRQGLPQPPANAIPTKP